MLIHIISLAGRPCCHWRRPLFQVHEEFFLCCFVSFFCVCFPFKLKQFILHFSRKRPNGSWNISGFSTQSCANPNSLLTFNTKVSIVLCYVMCSVMCYVMSMCHVICYVMCYVVCYVMCYFVLCYVSCCVMLRVCACIKK